MTPHKIYIGFVNHRPVSDTIRNPFDFRRHWESKLEIEQQPELKEDQDKPSKKHIDQVRRPYSIFPDHRLSHLTPHKMYIEFKRNRPFLDTMANKYDWRGWWKKKPEIELQQELKADQDRPREDFRSKYQEYILPHNEASYCKDCEECYPGSCFDCSFPKCPENDPSGGKNCSTIPCSCYEENKKESAQ
jgi:hypothetical protein